MAKSITHKATSGAVWASIDRFSTMGMQFIVNLILARLLMPDDFGMIGLIYIFLAVSQTLIDGGFGASLIQYNKPTQTDYSTIFFWNLFLSVFLYIILFIIAPQIAAFFKIPKLTSVVRIIGTTLIINSLSIVQQNKLRKNLQFKKIAIVNVSAYALSAAIAIYAAYNRAGVWSLVLNSIVNGLLSSLFVWIATKWVPSFVFSKESIKNLFSFGGYLLASNLLQTICQNLQGLIIGRKFSAVQMGYYSQAQKLDSISSYSIPQVLVQVMFPIFSSLQDERERLRSAAINAMRVISYVIFPLMAILILIADPLLIFLYGEKWLPSAPYFQILCVGGIFVCLQNVNFYVVASVGNSKSLFYWSFYKWGILLTALLVGMNFGMDGLLWGMVLSSINIFLTNAFLASKYAGIKVKDQLAALLPIAASAYTLFAIFYIGNKLLSLNFFILAAIYVVSYIALSHLLKLKAYSVFLTMTKEYIGSKIQRKIHNNYD